MGILDGFGTPIGEPPVILESLSDSSFSSSSSDGEFLLRVSGISIGVVCLPAMSPVLLSKFSSSGLIEANCPRLLVRSRPCKDVV